LLLLEARVLRRTNDLRARSTLEAAIDDLEAKGVLRPAALARRDLGLLELSEGKPGRAIEHLEVALPVLLQLDRSAAALACGGLAVLARDRGDRGRSCALASAAQQLLQPEAPTSAEDKQRLADLLPPDDGLGATGTLDDAEILELGRRETK
jgi:hypothetical protein